MSHDTSPDVPSPSDQSTSLVGFSGRDADELELSADMTLSWLWQGYLAPGQVTLLTSQWKTGKTTLVAVLLSKLSQGGTFLGQGLLPARRWSSPRSPTIYGWRGGRNSVSARCAFSAGRSAAGRPRSSGTP